MIKLNTPLKTPTSTISAIEIREARRIYPSANGQGDDAWLIVANIGGIGVPFCVKRQPSTTRVARNSDGTTKTDGEGAIVHETVLMPDVFDILVNDGGAVRTVPFEAFGAFDSFLDVLTNAAGFDVSVKDAMLVVGMIPKELNPSVG